MKKIYILEDNATLAELTQNILQKHGFSIEAFRDSEELLNQMNHEMPDLIILDNLLAGSQNGIDICQNIKTMPEFTRIPILLTTGQEIDFSKLNIKKPDAYLKKPFDPDSLLNLINSLLKNP